MSDVIREFCETGDFEAVYAAKKWLKSIGFSIGTMQAGSPRGLLYGDFRIAKWRNLSRADVAALHGTMTGGRNGPVVVRIFDDPAIELIVAALRAELAALEAAYPPGERPCSQ